MACRGNKVRTYVFHHFGLGGKQVGSEFWRDKVCLHQKQSEKSASSKLVNSNVFLLPFSMSYCIFSL